MRYRGLGRQASSVKNIKVETEWSGPTLVLFQARDLLVDITTQKNGRDYASYQVDSYVGGIDYITRSGSGGVIL